MNSPPLWHDADAPEWVPERQRETDAFFAARSDLAQVRIQVAAGAMRAKRSLPATIEGRRFSILQTDLTASPAVAVRDPDGASERVIVDVHALSTLEAPWLDWWYPSPNGRYVAFGVSAHASEQSVLHVVDVDTGRLLNERIPDTSFGVVAWLPDSSGFYYNRSLESDLVDPRKSIFLHVLGEDPRAQPEAATTAADEEYAYPQLSEDGRWLAAVSGDVEPRPDSIRDLHSDGGWRPFLHGFAGTFVGVFDDETYVCVTTDRAPRGRVVAIPIATAADRETWRELVSEGEGAMRQVSLRDGRLVVVDVVDSSARIRVFTAEGSHEDTVPLAVGTALVPSAVHGHAMMEALVQHEGDRLRFLVSSFVSPPAEAWYDLGARRLEIVDPAPPADIEITSALVRLRAEDGRTTSYWIVHRDDGDRPRPALIYGYGGWNLAFGLPGYLGELLPFVERGGAVVLPHLRGDGTYGESFWHEGRLGQKQRTFDDAALVATHIIESGAAAPGAIGLVGASNGGLLAAAALTQHPGLFRAVAPLVPLADMLEYTREPYPAEFRSEYGDPSDPAMRAALAAYSPLHAVAPGTAYPAVLVVCGDHDIRCPAWHGMRLVAALRKATTSDYPILFHVQPHSGHMTAQGISAPEWMAFLVSELGL